MRKNKFFENNELKDKEIIKALEKAAQCYEDGCLWEVLEECEEIVKAIKLFATQAEAIDFAKALAESQNGSITIHKVDGKIRKQDYSKK